MKILGYDNKTSMLKLCYATKLVYEYNNIQERVYDEIMHCKTDKEVRNILRRVVTVGTYKGLINEKAI
jgi:hypothetical protein